MSDPGQHDLLSWRAAETTDGPRPTSAIGACKPATPPDYCLAAGEPDDRHRTASCPHRPDYPRGVL